MSRYTCPDCGESVDDKGTPHEDHCDGSREDLLARVAELEAALARVAELEAALEEADAALSCRSCAEDMPPCAYHGDPHERIRAVLLGNRDRGGPEAPAGGR